MNRRTLVGVALVVGCRARTNAPEPVPVAVVSVVVDDAAPPPAEPAAPAPAVAAVEGGAPAFSSEAWLHEHGITTWPHDASCFVNMAQPPAKPDWQNVCDCNQSLTVDGQALLVCTRFADVAEPRMSPMLRTMLYAAKKGTIRLVVALPTYAALDGESFIETGPNGGPSMKLPVGNVKLAVSVEGAEVVVADDGESCVTALATAQREKLTDVRRVYGKVCASIGRYRFNGDQLVPQPAARSK